MLIYNNKYMFEILGGEGQQSREYFTQMVDKEWGPFMYYCIHIVLFYHSVLWPGKPSSSQAEPSVLLMY